LQLLAKGRNGDILARVGIDSVCLEAPDRIYHFAAFLNQLLSQTALAQEYEGGTVLRRWIAGLLIGAQSPEEGQLGTALKLESDSRWLLELKLQLDLAWPTALLTPSAWCDQGCYQRLANPTCAVHVTGGQNGG
jgi:hypothetical protein